MPKVGSKLDIDYQRPFANNWLSLRNCAELFVVIGNAETVGADAESQQSILDFLDYAVTTIDNQKVTPLYESRDSIDSAYPVASLPPEVLVSRLYRNRKLDAVGFSPAMGDEEQPLMHYLYRFALPRLIGLLRSEDPLGENSSHAVKCQQLQKANRVYEALFHAAEAREQQMPIEGYYFVELSALMTLGLMKEAVSYMQWNQCKGRNNERELYKARLRALSGDPQHGLQMTKAHLKAARPSYLAWLERARCLLMLTKYQEAIAAFNQCLAIESDCSDAWLGKGLALRAINFQPAVKDGLEQALSCFEKVIECGDFLVPEAYHHSGTIHLALEDWASCEKCCLEVIARDNSPVSRRNLCLVLHAQGRSDEAFEVYNYLVNCFPSEAVGLDRYFPNANTVVCAAGAPSTTPTEINKKSAEARSKIRGWKLALQDDLMDFRRIDELINYYAPAGEFVEGSVFHGMSNEELSEVCFYLSLHLGNVLVNSGVAFWVMPESKRFEDLQIQFSKGPGSAQPICLYSSVIRRLQAGASTDNLVSLDMLASFSSDYSEMRKDFRNPYVSLAAEAGRIEEFEARAEQACRFFNERGFAFDGSLNDLREMECVVTALYTQEHQLYKMNESGELSSHMMASLGLHLGCLFVNLAGGTWYDHKNPFGVAVKDMRIPDQFPVWRFTQRLGLGTSSSAMETLTGYEPAIVCAQLAGQIEEMEIMTREELLSILSNRLPSVMDEDPSGTSLGRIADMITLQANKVPWL